MDDRSIDEIERLLTQEDYEDLEATVRRHTNYRGRIVDILREQEAEIQTLRTGRRQFPGPDLAKP